MGKGPAFGTLLKVGTLQVETATVALDGAALTGSGNAAVVVTCTGMSGTPITTAVAVLENDVADTVATKIRTALNLVANITALFWVEGSGPYVVLRKRTAAANIANLNISIADDTCAGITTAASSADTVAGVAYTTVAYVQDIAGPGLAADTEDVTTHDQTTAWEETVATILRTGELSAGIVYDPNETTHAVTSGLLYRYLNKVKSAFQMTFPGPYTWYFHGYVDGFEPGAPVGGGLTASLKIKIDGSPTLV